MVEGEYEREPMKDDILFWLMDNVREIMTGIMGTEWDAQVIERERDQARISMQETRRTLNWRVTHPFAKKKRIRYQLEQLEEWAELGEPPDVPYFYVQRVTTQAIVSKENTTSVVDLLVRITCPSLSSSAMDILSDGTVVKPQWQTNWHSATFLFIVKEKMPSFHEVMQEVNRLKPLVERPRPGFVIVVSPNDYLAERFKEQGIQFIKYERGTT